MIGFLLPTSSSVYMCMYTPPRAVPGFSSALLSSSLLVLLLLLLLLLRCVHLLVLCQQLPQIRFCLFNPADILAHNDKLPML